MPLTKKAIIQEILNCCTASNTQNKDDILLSLAFKSEAELRIICGTLHIKTKTRIGGIT